MALTVTTSGPQHHTASMILKLRVVLRKTTFILSIHLDRLEMEVVHLEMT